MCESIAEQVGVLRCDVFSNIGWWCMCIIILIWHMLYICTANDLWVATMHVVVFYALCCVVWVMFMMFVMITFMWLCIWLILT